MEDTHIAHFSTILISNLNDGMNLIQDLLDLLSYVSEPSRVIIRLAMDTFVNYKVAFIQIFILL